MSTVTAGPRTSRAKLRAGKSALGFIDNVWEAFATWHLTSLKYDMRTWTDCGVGPSEREVEAGTLQCRGCCGHEPEKPTAKRLTEGVLAGAMQGGRGLPQKKARTSVLRGWSSFENTLK